MLDFADYADCVEYINQRPDYCDSYSGEWYYGDDETLTLYHGTFSNDHSPGCSGATWNQTFDTKDEYDAVIARLAAEPEYIEDEDEEGWTDDDEEADEMAEAPEGWAHL